MTAKKIDKRSDPAVRGLRLVRDGEDPDRIFCEGFRLVEELLKSGWVPQEIFTTDEAASRVRALIKRYERPGTPLKILSPDVMSFSSSVDSAPGIIALAKRRPPPGSRVGSDALVLVLNGLQNPSNVGAVLRSAEAAGSTAVWITRGTADPCNPKALRASSGSAFRLPVRTVKDLAAAVTELKESDVQIFAATQNGKVDHDRADWTGPCALVVGSEGAGFSEDELKLVDVTVRIPMYGSVESLNAATATAVCLFEAARQRRRVAG